MELVTSATVPLGVTPEPLSVAVQLAFTDAFRITKSAGHVSATWGAFLSIMLPLIGPATELLPALSRTVLKSVDALLVSVLAATLVVRLKLASLAFFKPAGASVAVHAMDTSVACQTPSAVPHTITGGVLS